MVLRRLSNSLNCLFSQKSDNLQKIGLFSWTNKDKASVSLTEEEQDMCQERVNEFRDLVQEVHKLNIPPINGFTAYDPKAPIGGDLL